ncbi:MAG: hypothetical protein U0Q15_15995 [Kineosporiaceae bacterium]
MKPATRAACVLRGRAVVTLRFVVDVRALVRVGDAEVSAGAALVTVADGEAEVEGDAEGLVPVVSAAPAGDAARRSEASPPPHEAVTRHTPAATRTASARPAGVS